ncbi:hypothetical protein HDU67_004006, partial [Dinochytrium kinnereticum]
MSFQQSLEVMLQNLGFWLFFPRPVFYLPVPFLTKTRVAVTEFGVYLKEILESARAEDKEPQANLLNMLVQASEGDHASGLSETELAGNAFAFILAGHETTAGALQFAL